MNTINYLDKFEAAVIYIEAHITENIKVGDVTESIGYSYYHFHRIFEAALGETIGNYIRRRKLACAARDLIDTDMRILDIAVKYGFESQEAFQRAFKLTFGSPPLKYRKNQLNVFYGGKTELDTKNLYHVTEHITLRPAIVEVAPLLLLGIRGQASIENNNIPQLCRRFAKLLSEHQDLAGRNENYLICEGGGEVTPYEFTETTKTKYFAGTISDYSGILPCPFVKKELAGGRYAVFIHTGKLEDIAMTYRYIWGTWALGSGFELDFRESFELYNERFTGPEDDSSECYIYIPVK